jgi:hypothetical protein
MSAVFLLLPLSLRLVLQLLFLRGEESLLLPRRLLTLERLRAASFEQLPPTSEPL